MDDRQRLAAAALLRLSANLEIELLHGKLKNSPLLIVLAQARKRAIDALVSLATVDPEKPAEVRALQNELRIFNDMVSFTKEIVDTADDAAREIAPEDADEVRNLIFGHEDRTGEDA